ncbi:MAG: DUF2235 domain-containing protein [Gammaproteobacteria bacterium]|nr:DUF2235 domain-containing protein [Gammaproteobacteria bacterium]
MGRNLVVACDGTWNTPTQTDRGLVVPTNVVKMARAVESSDQQLIYYDTGLGTGKGWDHYTGGLFGIGLTANIHDAYCWIANHYQDGDRLFLFGFSRGAYTVRSLSGLIGRCGLPPAKDTKAVKRAYDLYRQSTNAKGKAKAAEFKAKQRQPSVHFIGVWDTVGSLGVPALSRYGLLRKIFRRLIEGSKYAHGFHDETLGRHVLYAYQALGIDERRGPYEPSLWKSDGTLRLNVEQVWFAGVHTNVGGGYIDAGLSDHAFMWMAVKAMSAGLTLQERYLAMRVDPNCYGELRNSVLGIYKLLPTFKRKLARGNTLNEHIHKSVLNRLQHPTNSYRPVNLVHGLKAKVPITDDGLSHIEKIRETLYPKLSS